MELYGIYLAVSRFVLPALALVCVWLWIRLYRRSRRPQTPIAELEIDQNTYFSICDSEIMIGSGRKADIRLPIETIEKRHAIIYQRDDSWYICPLDGQVDIGEEEITEPYKLHDGEQITFGERSRMYFRANALDKPDEVKYPSGGLLLFVLTLFQLIMCGQICLRFADDLNIYIPIAFGFFAAIEWIQFIITRFTRIKFLIAEIPVMFLCTLGLAVTACIEPAGLLKQMACISIGLFGYIIFSIILSNQKLTLTLRPVIAVLALVVMYGTAFFGTKYNGSRNWLDLGVITVQPSEFAKVAFIFAGSSPLYITDLNPRDKLLFFGFTAAIMGSLAIMVDFGAVAIFFVCMLVILTMRLTDVRLLAGIVAAAAAAVVGLVALFPHISARFGAWMHVWQYADSSGYQQTRTMIAAGSGGMLGLGGGNGLLKKISAADTDLVFGLVCEEWGAVIGLCLVLCFVGLAFYAVRLSKHAKSAYYSVAVCAAASVMVFQTALNIFGSMDILPLTGVTIMFVSRGGTSLIAAFLMLAFFKGAELSPKEISAVRRRKN